MPNEKILEEDVHIRGQKMIIETLWNLFLKDLERKVLNLLLAHAIKIYNFIQSES
jgi:hypothetical protein